MKDTSEKFCCIWTGTPVRFETCKGIQAEDSEFCPHHKLLTDEAQNELDRRMEKARRGKERKKLMSDMLETSPLSVKTEPAKDLGYSK